MLLQENIRTINDLIHESAKEHKDKPYLRYINNDGIVESLSFTHFAQESDSIAAWTAEQCNKLERPVRVAMLSPNNVLYVKMLLGIMSGGGISVPIDPQMDQNTLCNCINKAEVDVLIYDKSINFDRESIREKCKNLFDIFHMKDSEDNDCEDIIAKYRGVKFEPKISEKDCAVIIFTSGTTGEEKGVMLSHTNLIDNVFNADFEPAVQISILPLHHAFGLKADILLALVIGSTTCFISGMDKLGEGLTTFEPTNLNMVPMIAQALYTKIVLLSQQTKKTLEECKPIVFGKNIKQIITGGAHLPAELVEKYHAIGVYACQGYGMTECSPSISVPYMDRPDKADTAGHIVRGCKSRVVDGELQVKSPSVMMGYVNAPELTAEIITEDGWLRTGDIGFEDEEGFIHITGRKKNLIILSNGANVSPEQIENLLLDHQLIEECLVYGEDSTVVAEIYTNEKYAKLNAISNISETVQNIVREVNAEVPSYKKIMKVLIRTVPFRKTGSGKIVRNQRATKEMLMSTDLSNDNFKMPENEVQEKIYNCIAEILGHKDFGIDTDIFNAGMDSLGCILTLSLFAERLNFNMELDEIITNKTVENLEKLYIQKTLEEKVDYAPRPVYPLTKVQQYFAYVIKGNTTSNVPALFELDESINIEKMQDAIKQLFAAHPILNDVIQLTEKGYANLRNDGRDISIPVIETTKKEWVRIQKTLVRPYMYTHNEPLYHIELYVVDGTKKYLFFDIAHIISDGVTLNILLEDLSKIYCGEKVEKEIYSFYDYILDEKYREEQGLRASSEEYFMDLMKGLKIKKTILNKKGHQDLSVGKNAALRGVFSNLTQKQVQDFCHKHGISENVLFLTAFNHCISIFSDEDDTVSTSIHNGRTDSRWGKLAGCLFVTYNFRHTVDSNVLVLDALKNSARQILETMRCHVNNLHADEMFFQYQGSLLDFSEIGGAPAKNIPLELDSLPFHLLVVTKDNGYAYELRYWENRFDAKQLKIFLEVYNAVLGAMLNNIQTNEIYNYLPESVFANSNCDGEAVIIDRYMKKQPIGAWGTLYLDGKTTGKTARLLIDGTIDFLEDSGRCPMFETLTGRSFPDLQKLEDMALKYDGVETASTYISYGENNKLFVTVEVFINKEIGKDLFTDYLKNYYENKSLDLKIIVSN